MSKLLYIVRKASAQPTTLQVDFGAQLQWRGTDVTFWRNQYVEVFSEIFNEYDDSTLLQAIVIALMRCEECGVEQIHATGYSLSIKHSAAVTNDYVYGVLLEACKHPELDLTITEEPRGVEPYNPELRVSARDSPSLTGRVFLGSLRRESLYFITGLCWLGWSILKRGGQFLIELPLRIYRRS